MESNTPPAWFIAIAAAALAVGFVYGRVLYHNPYFVIGAFLVGSALMYQFWAWVFARIGVFNPWHQYPSAWFGDLFVLPLLVAVPLVVLYNRVPQHATPYWFESWWWQVIAAVAAIVVAYGFRWTQTKVSPAAVLNSPWKYWHDWFAFPFLAYLLILGAPVFFSRWGLGQLFVGKSWLPLLPVVGLVIFFALGIFADRYMDVKAPAGNPRVDVYGWNWHDNTRLGPYIVINQGQRDWRWGLPASP